MSAVPVSSNLTTDKTLEFTSITGYTDENDVQLVEGDLWTFSAGTASLASGKTEEIMLTPNIDRSLWTALQVASILAVEAANVNGLYFHRLLFSFDNGTTWKRWTTSGWVPSSLGNIVDGNRIDLIQQLHVWEQTDNIKVAIQGNREDASVDGSIDYIWFGYGTEDKSLGLEPDTDSTTFPHDPETKKKPVFEAPKTHAMSTDTNHELSWATATKTRQRFPLTWRGLTESQRDTLVSYLNSHVETAFDWTPLGSASAKTWVVIEPPSYGNQGGDPDHYNVRCVIEEVLRG